MLFGTGFEYWIQQNSFWIITIIVIAAVIFGVVKATGASRQAAQAGAH